MALRVNLSRAEAVAEHVTAEIETRKLSPGDWFGTKQQIQDAVGVARSTVGEAVKLLCDRGLVTVRTGPGGGLFVADRQRVQLRRYLESVGEAAQYVSDALVVRDHLEFLVIADAARHRNQRDIADLAALVDELAATVDTYPAFLDAVWRLHLRLGEITPNQLLRDTYGSLVRYVAERTTVGEQKVVPSRQFLVDRLDLHAEIVRVVIEGRLDQVASAVSRHNSPRPGG
jgi:DNA-binding FadR family transcriptional regulator